MAAGAAWLAVDRGADFDPANAAVLAAGVSAAGFGFTVGIWDLAHEPDAVKRFARWRKQRNASPLSEAVLERYEGMLEQEAVMARTARIERGVVFTGFGIGAAAAIPLAAASKLSGLSQRTVYVTSAAIMLLSLIGALMQFYGETGSEALWRSYQVGDQSPSTSRANLVVEPAVEPHGARLGVAGRF